MREGGANLQTMGLLAGEEEVGGPDQNRTDDLLIANETLSQLSYGPTPVGTGGNMRMGAGAVKDNRREEAPLFQAVSGGRAGGARRWPGLASRPWHG